MSVRKTPESDPPSNPEASDPEASDPEASDPKSRGLSVFGRPLAPCSERPKTGFFRDGCCNTSAEDRGAHVVCARMTAEFLEFSRERGNDLSTPSPQHGFPGLQPGDRWCLCADRWKEAFEAGCAPHVYLASTHERVLDFVTLDQLKRYALDLN